jgi:hypothetical protein
VTTIGIFKHPNTALLAFGAILCCTGLASASTVQWTDWTSSDTQNGFTGYGTITTPTSTVQVTYTNANGISFYQYQPTGQTDYWTNNGPYHSGGRYADTSPYTSDGVENIPTGTDIIALNHIGNQTLTFSETIANPVFSYVSLNGNGYAFLNQDFDILSYDDPATGNDCGYWGCGTSYKNIVDLGNGNIEYQLLGTGEPHGTIQFKGAFDTVTWRSLSNENWNGFTVGVEGTAEEIFGPEPSTLWLLGAGIATIGLARIRRRKATANV